MPVELTGTTVCDGSAVGRLLVLEKPLSFWGGVDPLTGDIVDPRHPQYKARTSGRILVMERTIGSSSSSAIMLELLRNGVAPAGIVVADTDAILVLGILVASELGYPTVPLLRLGPAGIGLLTALDGCPATLRDGRLRVDRPRQGNA